MTDESNFTMIGNRPTLKNGDLLKFNYACSTCKCNMPCRLFSVVYQCKPLVLGCNIALVVTSVTPVFQLGKQLDVGFYYVAFTLSQGSLHYPGRSLHMNFTNIAFVSIQFSFKILSFLLSFKASVKRYFTFLSGCIYRMWLRI